MADRETEAESLADLADLLRRRGEYDRAAERARAAAETFGELGSEHNRGRDESCKLSVLSNATGATTGPPATDSARSWRRSTGWIASIRPWRSYDGSRRSKPTPATPPRPGTGASGRPIASARPALPSPSGARPSRGSSGGSKRGTGTAADRHRRHRHRHGCGPGRGRHDRGDRGDGDSDGRRRGSVDKIAGPDGPREGPDARGDGARTRPGPFRSPSVPSGAVVWARTQHPGRSKASRDRGRSSADAGCPPRHLHRERPQRNLEFWVETLGLRLVKRSVNQDDPGTYQLFFADAEGPPGTSATFLPWGDAPAGSVGSGQVARTAFRVPEGSLDYWEVRFEQYGVDYDGRRERLGGRSFRSGTPTACRSNWSRFRSPGTTRRSPGRGSSRRRPPSGAFTRITRRRCGWPTPPRPGNCSGRWGWRRPAPSRTGSRATSGSALAPPDPSGGTSTGSRRSRAAGRATGRSTTSPSGPRPTRTSRGRAGRSGRSAHPTERIDRHWFRSVYFRTPGGALFELATDGPGYDSDEPLEALGERLVLPGEFEDCREGIEVGRPEVTVPRPDGVEADD